MGQVLHFTKKPEALSKADLASKIQDDLAFEWEKHSKANRLHVFFNSQAAGYCDPAQIYIGDLNLLSSLENKIGIEFELHSGAFDGHEKFGWKSRFVFRGVEYETITLHSERHIRAFTILLFLKFNRELHPKIVTT